MITEVLTQWTLPPNIIDRLDKYYLIKWECDVFNLYSKSSVIRHQGITYQIIYHDCLPEHFQHCTHVAMSFRKLAYMPYGYVLVKPWIEKTKGE